MTTGEAVPNIPDLQVGRLIFLVKTVGLPGAAAEKEAAFKIIKEKSMLPYYKAVCSSLKIAQTPALISEMETANQAKLKELGDKIDDAVANLGETEISDAMIAKASYLAQIGEKDVAITAYEAAIEKTAPVGHKIDLLFALVRLGYFHHDEAIITKYIEKVKGLIEKGGDWDRRNRLKVYEGLFLISRRQFKDASSMLLDTLATFTSTEMLEYKEFVRYAVLTASLTLSRTEFKKKVLESPEILECVHLIPHISDFASSFYNCQYATFFKSLAQIEKTLKLDIYLHSHYMYYVREMRIRVYSQILESYRSVTIKSLATSFGVSEDWIDNDLAHFISAGRLNAVIDKVGGVVETNRPDAKNAQYQESLREGDNLLNSIQKLSRVINIFKVSSTTAQSPTSQENSLWAQIIHNLKEVAVHIEQSEGLTLKVDKVHKRMVDYLADKELTPSACSKLKELYSSTTTALEKESRLLERVLKNIKVLIELQEENDQVLRKRKADELKGNQAKKAKAEESSQLYIGTQVAAKVDQDWILAVVVNANEIKGKIEIEDIEEDDDRPGFKNRYFVPTSFIIPIVKTASKKEFQASSDVLALYPASSCFYLAKVVVPPSLNKSKSGMYVVKFDDDGDFEREITPSMILGLPSDA